MALLKKVFGIVLPLIVIAVVINDGGRYLRAMYSLSSATQSAAYASASIARTNPDRTLSWKAGDVVARKNGAEIYGYDLTDNEVHLWTRMPVNGTIALRSIHHYLAKEPATAPLIVDDEVSSAIR